jgi:tetratricopeptide (TPR) repeat protein
MLKLCMKRPRVPLLDSLTSARGLLENNRQTMALELIQNAIDQLQNQSQWQHIKTFLSQGFTENPQWVNLYSQALMGTRDDQNLVTFSNAYLTIQADHAPILLERTWALLQQNQYQAAFDLLNQIMPFLTKTNLGTAYKRRGLAQYHLRSDWQIDFNHAKEHLNGRLLGLALIDQAWCCTQTKQSELARDLLTQALPKLRSDHYHLAWARYNLGELALQTMNPDAERHYLAAETLTRHKEAQHFRSRAWQGIAKWRRYNQDFTRAKAAYEKAITYAIENDDKHAAYWSLGRTLRLSNQPNQALEILEVAKQINPQNTAIEIECAACWISLEHLELAKSKLDNTNLNPSYSSIAIILSAEILRQEKKGTHALTLLEQISFNTANIKEEIVFWKDLGQLAQLAGLEIPQVQNKPPNTVQVNACGVLQVQVNQTPIRISPTGRIGEFLALLLELQGRAHVETIIEYLYPKEPHAKKKYGAVWDLVKRLRNTLGWQESILVQGNTIQLDAKTTWIYDVTDIRNKRKASAYLEGIRSNWVLEVAQELAALEPIVTREQALN